VRVLELGSGLFVDQGKEIPKNKHFSLREQLKTKLSKKLKIMKVNMIIAVE